MSPPRCCGPLILLALAGCAPSAAPPAAASKPVPATPTASTSDSKPASGDTIRSADGLALKYDSTGEGEPALVLVHGWCCNRTFWKPQVDDFAKSHRVVAIDLAGHGESEGGRKQWTMEAFGQDVAAVVKGLKLKRVALIGHSMGGPVILEAAPLLKDELAGLVVVDAFHDPDESFTKEQIAEYRKPFDEDFPKAMRAALMREHDFFTEKTDPALIESIVATMTAAPPEMGVGAFQGMLDFCNERQRPLMKQVNVPFVCINAKSDPAKVEAGRRHAPQFDVVVLPESGHFLMREHPEEFNQLLEQKLAEFEAAQRK